jgi:phosphoribosyl 1,2-cyclic phosphodiesterase
MEGSRLRLKFWGVRGSVPTPQRENLAFGGNTPCLELRGPDGQVLVFDGGTGLRQLGNSLLNEFNGRKLHIHFFASHFHWDHIQGIPFFAPLYLPDVEVTFYTMPASHALEQALEGQMKPPYFPVNFEAVPVRRRFVPMDSSPLKCGGLRIHTFPMNHPQGAFGYRIESADAVFVYASDLEHGDWKLDTTLREHAQGADVLIYDAQYTPEEYEAHRGWGHSTWNEAVRVAKDSRSQRLMLFHHDPSHDDQFLYRIVDEARRQFENTEGAKEGQSVSL